MFQINFCNWRENFGIGNYKQVDDKPYGGGTGMVLKPEPIFEALKSYNAISDLYQAPNEPQVHHKILPNNLKFYNQVQATGKFDKVTIMMTPRGYKLNQQTAQWLTKFDKINILCGRYEGFDSRISDTVDLEISIGDFVLNGGEVGAMATIETVARLLPGFITKENSVLHDSFSEELNYYKEHENFFLKTKNNQKIENTNTLFDEQQWIEKTLPLIEHPQYTRPLIWGNYEVPQVLLSGSHKQVQSWRQAEWRFDK